jgi:hypothetical protein
MIPFNDSGYIIELDAWEDDRGTDLIEWFEEYQGFFPYWLRYVKDIRAINEYVTYRKGDWLEATEIRD